uniref:NADH-ubiquinone oxidoreductase chain 6 n=1 Tax=Dissostichus eleginoides TaxID=100907 RepID=I7HD68_DISEL|nr:NADH dehydrogenase subunit 6 [Dissostichus eleginoides]BAM28840.1 NADH dehydrogenase subunit 6 [Dissostichus eleginoides]
MLYCGYLFMLGVVVGMAAVAANPSPLYAAFGLVVMAAMGCGFIMFVGGTFSCLVLFLIYLGGMLVVFAYSVALCTDAGSSGLGKEPALKRMGGYLGLMGGMVWLQWSRADVPLWWLVGQEAELSVMQGETEGVSEAYGGGGILLVACAWALLVALYGALEVSRGRSRG